MQIALDSVIVSIYALNAVCPWKGGRVVECAGLEIRYTVIPYRGFKSHPFRQTKDLVVVKASRFFFAINRRASAPIRAPDDEIRSPQNSSEGARELIRRGESPVCASQNSRFCASLFTLGLRLQSYLAEVYSRSPQGSVDFLKLFKLGGLL